MDNPRLKGLQDALRYVADIDEPLTARQGKIIVDELLINQNHVSRLIDAVQTLTELVGQLAVERQ